MDFWTSTGDRFDHKSLLPLQAQQLLHEVGWAYYTIWKPATSHSHIGLSWSRGGVNESLLPQECRTLGHHLQNFYQQCASLIPLGLGLAGEAFASCQIRWASGEEMLRQIINSLSSQNWLPPPELFCALEANYFKTIVCIPLGNGAGVLEIGMTKLVPKNDANMNDRTLPLMKELEALINELETQGTPASWEEHIVSSCFEASTKTLPNNVGVQFWNSDEYYKSTPITRSSESREIFRHPSFMRSYNWSFSSTSSSSTFSTGDQMGSSNTTVVLNTSPAQVSSMNNEETSLMSPTTPKSTVYSFDELPVVNQFERIHVHGVSTPMCIVDNDKSYRINDADSTHFPHDYDLWYLSVDDVGLHGLQVPNRGEASLESRYLDAPSEPSMYHYPLLDHVLQPLPSASNTEVTSHDQQHQQWREMFPSFNEGERMCEQVTPHEHPMFWPIISSTPLVEDSLGDRRLEAKYRGEDQIMREQGGATLVVNDEGKYTSRNEKSNIGLSSTNYEGYQAFNETGYKMCNEQGGEMIASFTGISTVEADYGYVGYTSGPAEGGKGAGLSTSQGAGSYVSYASCSAEAEKGISLSIAWASSYGAGDSGRQLQRIRRQDDQSNVNVAGCALQGPDAREHHNQAERKRRSKQGEYINILHSLLPGNPKRDKVAILQGAIQHIKELKGRIKDLEGKHGQDKNSRQKIRSPKNDSCDCVNNTMPHDVLTAKIDVQDVAVNATNIDIMDALLKKNFSCFEYSSQFFESKNELSIKVLAHYKDEELDNIQHIKEWWEQLTKDYPKP